MNDPFDTQVRALQDRVGELAAHLLDPRRGGGDAIADAALAELSTALEELHVVGEELSTQTESLLESRELLERERQYFKGLFAAGPAAYLVTDPAGLITAANEPAAALFGVRSEFLTGKPLSVFLADDSRTAAFRLMDRAARHGRGVRTDLVLRRRTRGSVRVAALAAEAPTVDGGTELRWLLEERIDARDFDSLTPAEQTLRSAGVRLDAIVGSASDGIVSIDHHHRIVLFNRAAEELFGWSADEALGQPLSTIVPPDVADRHDAFVEQFASEQGNWRAMGARPPLVVLRRDGEPFPAEITISNARIDDHWVQTAIIRDVTAQQGTLRELRRADEFGRRVIASLDALVVVLDRDLKVVMFNAACERVTGHLFDDLVGRDLVELVVAADERDGYRARLRRVFTSGGTTTHEADWLTATGTRRRMRWTYAALHDESGEVLHVIGTGVDVTRERQLERQMVAAERLELLGQLAGGIAHDLNNVLAIIAGHVELLGDTDGLPGTARARVDSISAALRRAVGLVENLTTAKIEESAPPALLSVNAAVDSLAQLLAGVLGPTIELDLDLGASTDLVAIDPTRLEQVLLNLVLNARDAMPGGGRVTVSTRSDAAAAGPATLHLAVSDTGEGMDDEALAHAFEPFFTTKESGTGIGLATAELIIRSASGTMEATSAPAAGTTVAISLPAVAAAHPGATAGT